MNQRGELAENSGVPASRSGLLPQFALPSPQMPVPAEITVREAATGPYTNHEQEEIHLSCIAECFSAASSRLLAPLGPCRDAGIHPLVRLGLQLCSVPLRAPSVAPVAILAGGQGPALLQIVKVPLRRH